MDKPFAYFDLSNENLLKRPTRDPTKCLCSTVNNAAVSFSKQHTIIPENLSKNLKTADTVILQYRKIPQKIHNR